MKNINTSLFLSCVRNVLKKLLIFVIVCWGHVCDSNNEPKYAFIDATMTQGLDNMYL